MKSRRIVQSWTLSLALHLGLIAAVLVSISKLTIVLDEDRFSWEVSLVDQPHKTAGNEAPARWPSGPEPQASHVESPPQVKSKVDMPRMPQASAKVVDPVVEQPKPKPVQSVEEAFLTPIKPAETPLIKEAESRAPDPVVAKDVLKQEAIKESEPVREAVTEPAPSTYSAPPGATHTQESVQAHEESPAVPGAPPAASAEVRSSLAQSPAMETVKPAEAPPPLTSLPASSTGLEDSVQVAKAPSQPLSRTPEAKVDHRWVGESLWRRVAELKRYPSSARLNGLEGRVVLKAIIRADGQLAEVSVVKSSGHAVLDAAAMEAVKLACPLDMKHSIGPPQIVVSLPIVYSLAN